MKINRPISFASGLLLIVAAFVVPSSASAAGNPNCNAVDGDYIVSFAPGVNVDNELKNAPGRAISPKFRYTKVLNGFAASLNSAQVCAFQKRPNIENIELDGVFTIDTTQSPTPSWGLDRIDQTALPLNNSYSYTTDGTGVTAYVIDTGIQTNHQDFGTRASVGSDFVNDGKNGQDCNGHGTHVAGTIGGSNYGVAKNVSLVAVRVLNCDGKGSTSNVISGLEWVGSDYLANKVPNKSVANMSLGGGASTALDTAVNNLIKSGVVVVVAAGNSSRDACQFSPSRVPAAITVAASDKQDYFAKFSNRGSCVDIIAPGVEITSAWNTSTTSTNTISGTSMASPHVAGAIARYLSKNLTVKNLLDGSTQRINSVPTKTVNKILYVDPNN